MTSALALVSPSDHRRAAVVGLFLVAFALRLAVIVWTVGLGTDPSAEPASDSRIHMAIVRNLLAGQGFAHDGEPVATTPPLYVFFLAGLYALGAPPAVVRLLQALLGAAGCVLLYAVGRALFDPRTGQAAAALFAVHPALVYVAGLHLTENLFLPLLLLVLLQAARLPSRPTNLRAAALGATLGLAALSRAAFLAFFPFLLLWVAFTWGIRSAAAYRVAALVGLGYVLVLLPWTVRNALVLQAFVPVQSNGGLVFWAANNPHADGGLVWPTRRTWTASRPPDDGHYGWRDLNASQENALYVGEAVRWIREHPQDYLRLLAQKLARLYGFARVADGQDLHVPLAVKGFHVALYGLAAVGAFLTVLRRRPLAMLALLFVSTNVVALLFGGGSRYAIPMVPSLVLWAAFALSEVWRWASEASR